MIRRMAIGDLGAVAQIEKTCFTVPWSLETLKAGLSCPLDTFLVLEESGVLEGYGVFRVLAGEGEIQRIAVLPERRGRGHGRKLMAAMVELSRGQGASALALEVRRSNQAAINLYKTFGFSQEAVRTGYYANPAEDGILMWNRQI